MKLISRNKYIKCFTFKSLQESLFFMSKQECKNILTLDKTFGDNYYCYVCYHSLTKEKLFVISFCSDESEANLSFLFWDSTNMLIVDTGLSIYLVDEKLRIKASYDITTTLIGLYLTNGDNLLLLEEAFLVLVNSEGHVLKSELFDLIEKFSIENNRLSIQTSQENKIIELI